MSKAPSVINKPAKVEYDKTKMAAGRLRAVQDYPYFSSVLFALVPVPVPGIGTWAIDPKWRLYFDPQTVEDWTVEQVEFAWLHEAGHALREHARRAKSIGVTPATHDVWNVAGDCEINDDLLRDRLTPPFEVCHPGRFGFADGDFAESYYSRLMEQVNNARANDHSDGSGGGQGDQSAAGSGAGDDDSASGGSSSPGNDDSATPPGAGRQRGTGGQISGVPIPDCGSGADGVPRPWDKPEAADGSGKAADGTEGVNDAEQVVIRRKVAQDVLDAAKKGRGSVPGGLERWAQATLEPPKIPWRTVLRSAVRGGYAEAAGKMDYTFSRPSRRRVPNVVLPALRAPIPRVAIVVDTSGSMGQTDINAAWVEVLGALKALGSRREHLTVWACDADAEKVSNLHGDRPHLYGGGGTNMGVGMEKAMDVPRHERPNVLVVLTDGETPWPAQAPKDTPVVVGLIGTNPPPAPEWARSVLIDPND